MAARHSCSENRHLKVPCTQGTQPPSFLKGPGALASSSTPLQSRDCSPGGKEKAGKMAHGQGSNWGWDFCLNAPLLSELSLGLSCVSSVPYLPPSLLGPHL